jgi:hypothetical protein
MVPVFKKYHHIEKQGFLMVVVLYNRRGRYIAIECRFSLIDGFTKVTDKDSSIHAKNFLEEEFSLGIQLEPP